MSLKQEWLGVTKWHILPALSIHLCVMTQLRILFPMEVAIPTLIISTCIQMPMHQTHSQQFGLQDLLALELQPRLMGVLAITQYQSQIVKVTKHTQSRNLSSRILDPTARTPPFPALVVPIRYL